MPRRAPHKRSPAATVRRRRQATPSASDTTAPEQLRFLVEELAAVKAQLRHLLSGTSIATVFIDTTLRITRFTRAAAELLHLRPSDVGRPIGQVVKSFRGDVAKDVRAALGGSTPIEREVPGPGDTRYLAHLLPWRAEEGTARGAVLTFVDVTELKRSQARLECARDELARANRALQQRAAEQTRWLALLHDIGRILEEDRGPLDAVAQALRTLCDAAGWQAGYVYMIDQRSPDVLVPVVSHLGDERLRRFHLKSEAGRYALGEMIPGRVFTSASRQWLCDEVDLVEAMPVRGSVARQVGLRAALAVPITIDGRVIAVFELVSNRSHAPTPELDRLMQDVSAQLGRIFQRAETANAVWREQRALQQALHDSVGQSLTALGMLSTDLSHRLARADPAVAETARQVANQAREAMSGMQRLTKDLFPIESDPEGLWAALRGLAAKTKLDHDIHVRIEGRPVLVHDDRLAVHLCRVAQAAVARAVTKAQARRITIQLDAESGVTTLRVIDDGIILQQRRDAPGEEDLQVMRVVAASVGGVVSIEPGARGGTISTCIVREGRVR